MADSYLEYGGSNEKLKKLAENIKTTQTEEIQQMKDLIKKYEAEGHNDADQESAYLDEYDKMLEHDHSMSKSGTDSLDHAFAEGMICLLYTSTMRARRTTASSKRTATEILQGS